MGGGTGLVPITSPCPSDEWGEFTGRFELPVGFAAASMVLRLIADDGARILLNGIELATVNLVAVDPETGMTVHGFEHTLGISDPALFREGTNTIRFFVPNTQIGRFGSPSGRGGAGDCLYVAFEARVSYEPGCRELQRLQPSDGVPGDSFRMVAVDRDIAVIGAPGHDPSGALPRAGAAYVFRRNASTGAWNETGKLVASDARVDDQFGEFVALSGYVVAIGAFSNTNSTGAVYVFRYDPGLNSWDEEAKLAPAGLNAGDEFSRQSVAISGDVIVVGSHFDDQAGGNAGAAYVFRYTGNAWGLEQKLVAGDTAAGDEFGLGVAVSEDLAVITAFRDDDRGSESGSAYVFRHDPTRSVWVEESKLLASDGAAGDFFGWVAAVDGNVALVGAWEKAGGVGAAYVFRHLEGTAQWIEEQKLTASNGVPGDHFGHMVDISRDYAVIGAPHSGGNTGSAYAYCRGESGWEEKGILLASDGQSGNIFAGNAISISGDLVMIGALRDAGVVYAFQCACTPAPTASLELGQVESPICSGELAVPLKHTTSDPSDAASMGIASSPGVVTPVALDLAGALDAVNGGAGPDFLFVDLDAIPVGDAQVEGGLIFAYIVSLTKPGVETLPAVSGDTIAWIRYEPAQGATSGDATALRFVNGCLAADENSEPTRCVVTFDGRSVTPELTDGSVVIVPDDCFSRGDCNSDHAFDISDPVQLLRSLFLAGGAFACQRACDANDDGDLDVSDAVRMLGGLFTGMGPLPEPFRTCGRDSTPDALSCETPTCSNTP
ncbi:MAG: hypothetical protein HY721_18805 [Planctomycetes bacterium]|nr:hypothetical protein [Planctomycetota bacterium]